jgi:hypothetical protein
MLNENFDKMIKDFSKVVNKAILCGEFQVLDRKESYITVRVGENTCDIWLNANNCHIWSVRIHGGQVFVKTEFPIVPKDKCRKILLKISEEEKAKIREQIKTEQARLEMLLGGEA